jgi:undecaprenyl-diphosphatase
VISAIHLPTRATARVADFDRWVDDCFQRSLRRSEPADRVFYAASAVGDHGLLWMGLAGLQAVRRGPGRRSRPLLRAVLGLAAESIVVNGPIKWLFRRERPVSTTPRTRHLRTPRTSSFPSGHASAAFYGAAVLRDDDPWWPLYYLLALVVAGSRVHVRIHHASDVVGGIVVGVVLGELTRALVPLGSADVTAVDTPVARPAAG